MYGFIRFRVKDPLLFCSEEGPGMAQVAGDQRVPPFPFLKALPFTMAALCIRVQRPQG